MRSHHRWRGPDRLACNAWWGPPQLRITVADVPTFLSVRERKAETDKYQIVSRRHYISLMNHESRGSVSSYSSRPLLHNSLLASYSCFLACSSLRIPWGEPFILRNIKRPPV